MYRRVLIITDNLILSQKFNEIIEGLKHLDVKWTFALSPFSNSNDFEELLGKNLKVYDLKNEVHIEDIIKNNDLVLSLHCKQLFPDKLVNSIKCINIHPGYNPINRGWYPQVFSIINNFHVGATIHEIDEKLDHGPIIAREFVEKKSYDTSESLYNRIVAKELELLDEHLEDIISDNYETFMPENEGNLFLKKDFDNLLELDLNENIRVGYLIDKLRALTHSDYNNAYYYDLETGKKIFVRIQLNQEENE